MTDHTDLLEQSFEINLNNYGPEDVERLNDWAINAYAALEAAQAENAQPERAPLSDAELEQEFCNITGLETGINPAAADTKRALVWFKKGYAHAIKQGGQHD